MFPSENTRGSEGLEFYPVLSTLPYVTSYEARAVDAALGNELQGSCGQCRHVQRATRLVRSTPPSVTNYEARAVDAALGNELSSAGLKKRSSVASSRSRASPTSSTT